jgi:hypothetical protein
MRELMSTAELSSTRPLVAISFSSIEGLREILALNLELGQVGRRWC